ncbi:sugar phosphate isomerase/epimerase family protein [Alcaligenes parafaecalis]|uniref:Sugar phosphate isomerase/epimerase n=1 Tax=Alcaligenes parafaecalis TaxID=171260 RepID=A0ABT3VK06_9BURK|nr:sugar phosphate isomerase/epimerase family protein [Alcaligenes parafaecalis]MCX5463426.1 sugar phosphate isomerase/epimerase [Alcaligenes parafaecalis]
MSQMKNSLIFHTTITPFSNLALDLDIMRTTGFDGIELGANKVGAFLASGHTQAELGALMQDVHAPGIGFLIDLERQGELALPLWQSAHELFDLAVACGAKGVQVLTGPLDVCAVEEWMALGRSEKYIGLLGVSPDEQISLTASNLRVLADMAAEKGLLLYLETLAWSPVSHLDQALKVIEATARENVKVLIDYWHCYTSGVTPDQVARLDKDLIYGVHVCDSLNFPGGIPDEKTLRDVPTGQGVLDLQVWTDAVRATGYEGWWSCELFCRKQHQENSYQIAASLRQLMQTLIA